MTDLSPRSAVAAEDERYCLEFVREHDHDRYLAALFLPADRRRDVFALLAFNAEIARTREIVSEPLLGQIRLQWWREALEQIANGQVRDHPVVRALAGCLERYPLDRTVLERMVDAREADLDAATPADMMALTAYARETSGHLQRLSMKVLRGGDAAQDAARDVGTAWAFVGLARSVAFHAQARRLYIPDSLMSEYEVERRALFDLKPDPRLNTAVRRLVEEAERLLAEARTPGHRFGRVERRGLLLASLADLHIRDMRMAGFDPFAFPAGRSGGAGRLAWNAILGRY